MIGRLRGELLEVHGALATIDVGGVGYEVLVPESVMVRLPSVGQPVDLRIRQIFREDGVYLYGFTDVFQRRLFDLLTEVKGCGPKISLAVVGQLGEQTVVAAILNGDVRTLSRANGVGQRLAERIILELKDKIAEENAMQRIAAAVGHSEPTLIPADDKLVEALVALGYRRQDAERAAAEVSDTEGGLEAQIKLALRGLAR